MKKVNLFITMASLFIGCHLNAQESAVHYGSNSGSIGEMCTFIGDHAGYHNIVGKHNTFLGYYSGYRNDTGSNNSFLGYGAGFSNTNGYANTFIGHNSGEKNVSGQYNTSIGAGAGRYNTSGIRNTSIGNLAGFYHNLGDNNTYIGNLAGYSNRSGNKNTIIGGGAGAYIADNASGNVYIGFWAGRFEQGSNKLYIANDSSSTPLIYGEFDNRLLRVNGKLRTGENNIADYTEMGHGGSNGYINVNGTGNLDFRHEGETKMSLDPTGKLSVKGDYYGKGHIFLHAYEGDGMNGTAYVQARDKSGSSNIALQFRTQENGTFKNALRITPAGKVGVGTTLDDLGDYDMVVEGKLGAREIVVQAGDWADFVFDDNYNLKDLNEVNAFIKANKHLPDVPSEAAVKANGVDLGAMDAILLQKIEELTLYIIQIKKDNDELRSLIQQ